MQRTRSFTPQRLYGMGFILVVMFIIMFIHVPYVWLSMLPRLENHYYATVTILVIYHIFFTLFVIAFYQSIMTDPGIVPPNWGFYMGDETKRRRYCKMCNVWKPDRTHHCSICNRCILNMDHHCPWINNCVGFYNRKFFIQLLVYVYMCLWIVLVTQSYDIFKRVKAMVEIFSAPGRYGSTEPIDFELDWTYVVVPIAYILAWLLVCTLTNFIRFHMTLVLDNYTTIENLEREEGAKSKFDIGRRRNWEQVFGCSWHMWWLPMHLPASRPVGDGVRWRVHYTRVIDEDEELPADEEGTGTGRMFAQGSNTATSRSGQISR